MAPNADAPADTSALFPPAPLPSIMPSGTVVAIHVAPESGALPEPVDRVEAVAGRGLRGDRYFLDRGTFSGRRDGDDVTFIDRAALETARRETGIDLTGGLHRRNVTTEGVDLGDLVGERFRVGGAVCEGREPCPPCRYLESKTETGARAALADRGGLRARIVESGVVELGDPVGERAGEGADDRLAETG